ncbi:hypothetical protein [Miltoncostaea oceani]|uniref:hypothetical protein n=1 Tax=Miltoncostaea oceani TaxID=2843216 RepID=UPI001C3E4CB0|nr:hypothetical protein [Miltoncostaea oceani]
MTSWVRVVDRALLEVLLTLDRRGEPLSGWWIEADPDLRAQLGPKQAARAFHRLVGHGYLSLVPGEGGDAGSYHLTPAGRTAGESDPRDA